jgi:hypothetical protein
MTPKVSGLVRGNSFWDEDAQRLFYGVQLILANPEIANMSCEWCEKYDHRVHKKEQDTSARGQVLRERCVEKAGKLIPAPPCHICPKIPKNKPKHKAFAYDLSPKLQKTLKFYRECKATGYFPDDPIVKWAAGIISEAMESIDPKAQRLEQLIVQAIQMKVVENALPHGRRDGRALS